MTKSAMFPGVDVVLALGPSDLLKASGFKGRRTIRVRQQAETVECVHFRSSQHSSSSFEVVLAVFLPLHHELLTGRSFPTNPYPGKAAPLVKRMLAADPEVGGLGSWWNVQHLAFAEPIARAICRQLQEDLAFFEHWRSLEDMLGRLRSGDQKGVAEPDMIGTHALVSLEAARHGLEAALERLRVESTGQLWSQSYEERLRARLLPN